MKSSLTRRAWMVGATCAAIVFCLSGCEGIALGPTISSVTITPSTIPQSSTGMTDEFFEVRIVTSGITSEITGASIFIQDLDPPRRAETREPLQINGSTVVISKIPTSWFSQLEPGTYDLEASVMSDEGTLREASVATVTVTP